MKMVDHTVISYNVLVCYTKMQFSMICICIDVQNTIVHIKLKILKGYKFVSIYLH